MAKGKTGASEPSAPPPPEPASDWFGRMVFQGWVSIAVWMGFGLLLEGLLGYKIPPYLGDPQRRELFRLAHTHGTFLGLVVIAAALCARRAESAPPRAARLALRLGSVLMPVGFLLAGVWHPESDPGPAIWIVPPAALLVIFGAILTALYLRNKPDSKDSPARPSK